MENSKPEKRKSIYPPVEVVLNEEKFKSRKFTHSLLLETTSHEQIIEEKSAKLDIESRKEVWASYCKWMLIVFGVKKEKLEETELSEVEDAYMKVKLELLGRQKVRMTKSIDAVKGELDEIKDSVGKATDIEKSVKEIEKNVSRSGKPS